MKPYFNLLAKTNVFSGLKPEEIYGLLANRHYQAKQFDKNDYVAYAGEECRSLMIVLTGSVRGEMSDFSGKTIKIEDIQAPSPLAAAFLFGKENRYPVDIIANEYVTVLVIQRDLLIDLLQKNKLILKNFLFAISSRTQFLTDRIRFLTLKTLKEKIANYILSHGGRESDTVMLDQSQTELAVFFGVTRPSLARALAELKSEGILNVEKKKYTIRNKEKLNKLLKT